MSLGQLATSTALGVGTSWAGGVLGDALAPAISGITSSIASPVISQAVAGGISNSATGFALGTGVSLISGKSFADALSDGASAAASGAGMGFITGGISGYKYAKDNDLNPWSGRSTPLDPGTYAGVEVTEMTSRLGKDGPAIEATLVNGNKIDINAVRVKEWAPNLHPSAPPGTLNKIKFENSIPGSKGFKRLPTPLDLNFLKRYYKK